MPNTHTQYNLENLYGEKIMVDRGVAWKTGDFERVTAFAGRLKGVDTR